MFEKSSDDGDLDDSAVKVVREYESVFRVPSDQVVIEYVHRTADPLPVRSQRIARMSMDKFNRRKESLSISDLPNMRKKPFYLAMEVEETWKQEFTSTIEQLQFKLSQHMIESLYFFKAPTATLHYPHKMYEQEKIPLSWALQNIQYDFDSEQEDLLSETKEEKDIRCIPLLQSYYPNFSWDGGIASHFASSVDDQIPSLQVYGHEKRAALRFMVCFGDLELTHGLHLTEPFFLEFAVFDISKRRKVTESFWLFHDPDGYFESIVGSDMCSSAVDARVKSCIFTISSASENLNLVCKVYGVLQGELKPSFDLYALGSSKSSHKQDSIALACKHFRSFKQLMFWSSVSLFDESNEFHPERISFSEFFTIPLTSVFDVEQLCTSINDKSHVKRVPGFIDASVRVLDGRRSLALKSLKGFQVLSPQHCVVDLDLRRSGIQSPNSPVESSKTVKEVIEFPSSASPWFHEYFVNMLFIYPLVLQLGEFRNVSVRVQVMNGDIVQSKAGLPLVFGKSPENPFVSFTNSSVTYHLRNPTFQDEMKVKLPLNLDSSHFLLFTFLNINVSKKKVNKDATSTIGYSVLPLYLDERIPSKEHTLVVYKETQLIHYLHDLPKLAPETAYDPSKMSFQVKLKVMSSIHSSDPYLNKFFKDALISPSVLEHIKVQNKNTFSKGNNQIPLPSFDLCPFSDRPAPEKYRSGYMMTKSLSFGPIWKEKWFELNQKELKVYKTPFHSTEEYILKMNPLDFGTFLERDKDYGSVITIKSSSFAPVVQKVKRSSIFKSSPSSKKVLDRIQNLGMSSSSLHQSQPQPYVGQSLTLSAASSLNNMSWIDTFIHVTIRNGGTLDALNCLTKAKENSVIHFYPQIVIRLLRLMMSGGLSLDESVFLDQPISIYEKNLDIFVDKCRFTAFLALIKSFQDVDHISQSKFSMKTPSEFPLILQVLTRFIFTPPHIPSCEYLEPKSTAHEAIVLLWVFLLRNRDWGHSKDSALISFKYSWVLFGFISKSMIVFINDHDQLALSPDVRSVHWDPKFLKLLSELLLLIADQIRYQSKEETSVAEQLNAHFALFLRDMFTTLPRVFVFPFVELYVKIMQSGGTELCSKNMFSLFRVLGEFEHFVPICGKSKVSTALSDYIKSYFPRSMYSFRYTVPSKSSGRFVKSFSVATAELVLQEDLSIHFIPLLLMYQMLETFQWKSPTDSLPHAIDALLHILMKLDFDSRYVSKTAKSAIFSMFLPLTCEFSQHIASIRQSETKQRKDLLACVASLWKNTSFIDLQTFFASYWSSQALFQQSATEPFLLHRNANGTTFICISMQNLIELICLAVDTFRVDPISSSPLLCETTEDFVNRTKEHKIFSHEALSVIWDTFMMVLVPLGERYLISPSMKTSSFQKDVQLLHSCFLQTINAFLSSQLSNKLFIRVTKDLKFVMKRLDFFFFPSKKCSRDLWKSFFSFLISRWFYNDETCRSESIRLTCLIFESQFQVHGTITFIQNIFIESFSAFLDTSALLHEEIWLNHIQNTLNIFETSQFSNPSLTLSFKHFSQTLQKLFTLSLYSAKSNFTLIPKDENILYEMYISLAFDLQFSQSIRLSALKQLRDIHLVKGNFINAARCLLEVVELERQFQCFRAPKAREVAEEELHIFLLTTSSLFVKGYLKLPECAVAVLEIALEHLETQCRLNPTEIIFKRLDEIHSRIHAFSEMSFQYENKSIVRSFDRFYRIGFFGSAFDQFDGTEFIYKQPPFSQLLEIKDMFSDQYSEICDGKLQIIFSSKKVISNDSMNYIQIIAVDPIPSVERPSSFLRNLGTLKYVFFTPFTESGKARGAIDEQFKRRTVLSTKDAFPFMAERVRVVKTVESVMTPIEVTIDDIHSRNRLLEEEIRPMNGIVEFKTLSQLLSGSVCVQVNGGTGEVCDVFLGVNESRFDTISVVKLKQAVVAFFALVREALPICKRLCQTESQKSLYEEFESGYTSLWEYCEFKLV